MNVSPRREYPPASLHEADVAPDPCSQFRVWFADALDAELTEPDAMTLATATAEGAPAARTVLLKGVDEEGFVFFTNYGSRKAADLAANPRASLVLLWRQLARQVVVTGGVERLTAEESDVYFATRPRGSQIGAWASEQSQVVESRAEIERRYAEMEVRFAGETAVPRPPFWGGFRVVPETVEFWQGRPNRLHDRLRYRREPADAGGWIVERLSP